MDAAPPHDFAALADLSHRLEGVALKLATDGIDPRVVAQEIEVQASGEREAVAIALSYLLRHRNLGTWDDSVALDVAIDAAVTALRRAA